MSRRALVLFALGAALSACSSESDEYAPGPASEDEQQALSEAAEMLDERPAEEADSEVGNR